MNSKVSAALIAACLMFGNSFGWAAKKPAAKAAPKAADAGLTNAVLVDDFEAGWNSASHETTTVALEAAPGRTGNGQKITYDLKDTKQWVAVSKPLTLGNFSGKALEFWVKGKGKNNVLEIKVMDGDGSNFGVKKEGLTATPGWTRVVVTNTDLAYWWGGDKVLGPVTELHFAISAADGGAGEVLLDDLRVGAAPNAASLKDGVIDDGESLAGWATSQAEGAKIALASEMDQDEKALAITYSIPENLWVNARKTVNTSVPSNAAITFFMKGTGDPNNVEIKLLDRDESVFGKVLEQAAGNGAWQEIRIPVSELKHLWGGDDQLDTSLIRYVDIAISGPGGKGKVLVDNLKIAQ
ncbi:MAG TPA: carbohydrate binding domain-containing protein [Elusimicrobiota bacterium]|nr:carbohydrate binding domain-containing protein [Elusimicrobiota bacterium]